MKLPLILLAVNLAAGAECVPVRGERILGSDLALADPGLSVFSPGMSAGLSPSPGVPRLMTSADLVRLARAEGVILVAPPAKVCFEFEAKPLTAEGLKTIMQRALPPSATLEIVDFPHGTAPTGEVHFPLTSLEPGPDVRTWRGYVQYTPTRRFPLSARVRVSYTVDALVLTSDVAAGQPIPQTAYEARTVAASPVQRVAVTPDDLRGRVLRTSLRAGQTIPLSALNEAAVIRRGDVVRVDVRCGPAHLQLDAVAQRAGRNGETVELLNPASGKLFRARLEGSMAVVALGGTF